MTQNTTTPLPVVVVGSVWYSPGSGNTWYVLGSRHEGKHTLWEVRRPQDKESYWWRTEAFVGMEDRT